jgi:glutamate dehydrogenase (NAD(P)+)
LSWEEREVNTRLEIQMRTAYQEIAKVVSERKLPMRTAAFVVAIERVKHATDMRGLD